MSVALAEAIDSISTELSTPIISNPRAASSTAMLPVPHAKSSKTFSSPFANDPIFLAADEPTGSLDSRTADAVFHVFEQLVAAGKTIFMATHDRELAERASRIIRIEDGEILEQAADDGSERGST